MLWHLEIHPSPDHPDLAGKRLSDEAVESGLPGSWSIAACRGFLIEGAIDSSELERAARSVLVDPVVESFQINPPEPATGEARTLVHVMPKPGVTDPEAESALE